MASLVLDELSIALLLALLALLLCHTFLLRPPQPQAHPILLGKQGDATTVRNAGESAVWRSNLAMGRMVMTRPAPSVHSIADLLVEPKVLTRAQEIAAGLKKVVKPGVVVVYTTDYDCSRACPLIIVEVDQRGQLLSPLSLLLCS
jgi:hypothetical protein